MKNIKPEKETKNVDINERIRKQLFELQDLKYRNFNSSLIPTVDKETVIGVRTPQLRKLAKELSKDPDIGVFLRTLPHKYYEENNLHGLIIEGMKDYDKCIAEMELFLPYIDNWATCDIISPKVFKKHLHELLDEIKVWIGSDHTYTIRFGIEMLMTHYLDADFRPKYLEEVSIIKSKEYYVFRYDMTTMRNVSYYVGKINDEELHYVIGVVSLNGYVPPLY